MKMLIKKKTTISDKDNLILLCDIKSKLSGFNLSKKELEYIKKEQKDEKEIVVINHYGKYIIVILPKKEEDKNQHAENCRLIGDTLAGKLKDEKSAIIVDVKGNQIEAMQIAEGIALSNYTFTKHKT